MSWLDIAVAIAASTVLFSIGFTSGCWWAAARIQTLLKRLDEQWREW